MAAAACEGGLSDSVTWHNLTPLLSGLRLEPVRRRM